MIGKTFLPKNAFIRMQLCKKYSVVASSKIRQDESTEAAAKPFNQIPKISRVKMILNSFPGGKYYNIGLNDMHKLIKDEYGNIVRMPPMLGKPEVIFSYSEHDNETILLNEGNWPNRYSFEILKYFREKLRPDVYGGDYGSVASENGERWYKVRTIANQVFLPPKVVQQYVEPIDEISSDFIEFVKLKSDQRNIEVLGQDLNLWSLESIANVTLGKRLGILNENNKDGRAKELIKSVRDFFVMTVDFELNPSIWRYYQTKAFKEYMRVNNRILNIVMSYIDETLNDPKFKSDQSEKGIIYKLLKEDRKVAIIMACDALFAGIDTTASAIIGLFFCLAKNPEKQEKLRQEILRLFPNPDEPIDAKKMSNMPYLRSCIKEGLRLYPPVSGSSRITQKEMILSGYHIPIGTNVVTWPWFFYRKEKYFPNANSFQPERWLKDASETNLKTDKKPYFLPFGHGVRACPGMRIAYMEMEVLLINLLRKFRIEWHQKDDLKVRSVIVNVPVGDIRFKLTNLNNS